MGYSGSKYSCHLERSAEPEPKWFIYSRAPSVHSDYCTHCFIPLLWITDGTFPVGRVLLLRWAHGSYYYRYKASKSICGSTCSWTIYFVQIVFVGYTYSSSLHYPLYRIVQIFLPCSHDVVYKLFLISPLECIPVQMLRMPLLSSAYIVPL